MWDDLPEYDTERMVNYLARLRHTRAVTGIRSSLVISKRDLLLFDSVMVFALDEQLDELHRLEPETVAAAEYLAEQDFLESGPQILYNLGSLVAQLLPESSHDPDTGILPRRVRLAASKLHHPMSAPNLRPPGTAASILAHFMNLTGYSASSIYEGPPTPDEWVLAETVLYPNGVPEETRRATEHLIQVVTDYLPVPGPQVPLSDIVDFASDAKTRELKQRLLRATRQADLNQVSAEQFALNLEECLAAYKEHMSLIGANQRGPILRLLLSATGAIEELAHLRPRKAVEALLEFRTSRVTGLEAELKASGRETAYIYRAEKAFPPDH